MAEKKPETKVADDKKGSGEAGNTDESGEETGEKTGGDESGGFGSLASPEGFLMMTLAIFFDIIGLIPIVGTVSNIFAGIFFITWTFTKPGGAKKVSKFLLALVLEAIPIVSDITPFVSVIGIFFGKKIPASWIGYVYSVL